MLDSDCSIHPALYIKTLKDKGRAVFAHEDLSSGMIIETSPVVVMTRAERVLLDQTKLHDYLFEWGEQKDQCAMALGYLAIYNHSYESNCEYFMNYETQFMQIKTVRHIPAGEELTVNYNGDWNSEGKLWFDAKQ